MLHRTPASWARLGALGPLAPPSGSRSRGCAGRRRLERRGTDAASARRLRARSIGWLLNCRFGYGGQEVTYKGDPSVASVELGHAFREILARDCLEVVEAVTAGRRVASDVRSIASDHAVIQPGFLVKAGAVVVGAAAIVGILL